MRVLQPAGWARPRGYSNGIVATGEIVFVAGQIGWDASQQFVSDDLIAQMEQALRNVIAVLAEAGAAPEHVARMTWYITDRNEYVARLEEVGRTWRSLMGRHYPVMSVVEVSALVESRGKIEIEVTAVIPARPL
jgi:enamine deaminase RidA (YjgF/YER057c/UK114 family)